MKIYKTSLDQYCAMDAKRGCWRRQAKKNDKYVGEKDPKKDTV